MKRNFDLIKQILLHVESFEKSKNQSTIKIPGYSSEEVWYHVYLLNDAGLLLASESKSPTDSVWTPHNLTWAGHEFLDSIKDDAAWEKAKSVVKSKTGGITFELLKVVLSQFAKDVIFGKST